MFEIYNPFSDGDVYNYAFPNYTSSVYDIQMRITDGKIFSPSKTLTVSVENSWGDAPYINLPNTTTVTEFDGAGTTLFQVRKKHD
jgi:hypothetical protein